MSRLADMMTATQSASALASGASNGLFAATRDELAPVDFQALFAQELSAQESMGPAAAAPFVPEMRGPDTKEQNEAKVFESTLPNAAEVVPWLPVPVPSAPLHEAAISGSATPQPIQIGATQTPAGDTALPEPRLGFPSTAAKARPGDVQTTTAPWTLAETSNTAAKRAISPAFSAEHSATAVNSSATPTSLAPPVDPTSPTGQTAAGAIAIPGGVPAPKVTAAPTVVNTPFSAPAWREDFTQQVVVMAKTEVASAEIKLNPPQLGPIEISLSIKNDIAEANFAAASAPVREAIEASLPRLKEMFAEVGITLGNTSVSQQFGEARQTFGESASNLAQSRGSPESDSAGKGDLAQTAVIRRRSFGWVDTFA